MEYILSSFPQNYRLYEHIKTRDDEGVGAGTKTKPHAGGGHERSDAYLYGHPEGRRKRYRSPAEFFPHLLWLSAGVSVDTIDCTCRFCAPDDLQPKKAAPKQKVEVLINNSPYQPEIQQQATLPNPGPIGKQPISRPPSSTSNSQTTSTNSPRVTVDIPARSSTAIHHPMPIPQETVSSQAPVQPPIQPPAQQTKPFPRQTTPVSQRPLSHNSNTIPGIQLFQDDPSWEAAPVHPTHTKRYLPDETAQWLSQSPSHQQIFQDYSLWAITEDQNARRRWIEALDLLAANGQRIPGYAPHRVPREHSFLLPQSFENTSEMQAYYGQFIDNIRAGNFSTPGPNYAQMRVAPNAMTQQTPSPMPHNHQQQTQQHPQPHPRQQQQHQFPQQHQHQQMQPGYNQQQMYTQSQQDMFSYPPALDQFNHQSDFGLAQHDMMQPDPFSHNQFSGPQQMQPGNPPLDPTPVQAFDDMINFDASGAEFQPSHPF